MIGIVGAGPAGSHVARLLAERGEDVHLFEEHTTVGNPCQCTGIVTHSFKDVVTPRDDFVVNRIKRFRVYSPNNNHTELQLDKEELILDRPKFDQHMADRAVDAGVKLHVGHKFVTASGNGVKKIVVRDLVEKKEKEYTVDYLIGADGPSSSVGRTFNMLGKRVYYSGAQATVKYNLDRDLIETYFGGNFPEFFGWITPENENVVRIGLATKKQPFVYFKKFLRMKGIKDSNVLERQGGMIPVYTRNVKTRLDNVFLVGDAALQIKATTGGGIILGMLGAEALANSIFRGSNYEKEWRRRIGKDLLIHALMRRVLNKFSDEDYNYLTTLCNKPRVRRIIKESDREFPSQFMMKLLMNEPRFLYYGLKLF